MSETEKGNIGHRKKARVVRKVVRILLKSLVAFVLLFALLLLGLNVYLKSNKTKIFSNIPLLNDGSFSFQSAAISVFRHFPAATISLENLSVRDAQFERHGTSILQLRKLTMAASLLAWRSKQVEIQSFELEDGSISLFTDEDGYGNLKNILSGRTDDGKTRKSKLIEILTDKIKVSLTDVNFHFTDAIKTTSIHARLDDLTAVLNIKDKKLKAAVDMSLLLEELTFKKENGSFAANSKLSGKLNMQVVDGNIIFEPFPLHINEQVIVFGGNYDTRKQQQMLLTFENEATIWSQSVPLLTQDIQGKIAPYHIEKPFYSKTTVSSYLKPNEPVLVNIDFRLDNANEVTAKGFLFEQVAASGRFTNRLHDGLIGDLEDGRNLRIVLNNVNAIHDVFHIDAPDALITSTPFDGPMLRANLIINGKPSGISKWLKNNKFFFKRGSFNLVANVDGPMNKVNELVINSEAKLTLNNFSVVYKPSDTSFPFKHLSLYKKQGDADFEIISSTLENGHEFFINGGVKNLKALLFALAERSTSTVDFVAEKISWTDFLNLFGESGYLDDGSPKNEAQKKKSMKATIRGIQFHFQPRLTVAVDTLQYFDKLELHNVRTGVHFQNEDTLILEKTSFRYKEGEVSLKALLDIKEEGKTPFNFEMSAKNLNLAKLLPPLDYFNIKLLENIETLPENVSVDIKHRGIIDDQKGLIPSTSTGEIVFQVDKGKTLLGKVYYEPARLVEKVNHQELELGNSVKTKIVLDGDPALFNQFFKTDRFFFSKGKFYSQLQYEGNVRDFEELLSKGDAEFKLQNSEVYYKQANVSFPLTEINLSLHEDNADFYGFMDKDSIQQEIKLEGRIENLSEVVIGNTGKEVKTFVDITSTKIRWQQFLKLFSPKNDDEPDMELVALKNTAKGILSAFNPDVCVFLDTFIYSEKLKLYDVQTGISLRDTATLVLDKTGFRFHDGTTSMQGTMNLGVLHATPFSGQFQTDKLDVALLLESLDYLEIPSFKDIKKLSGQSTLNLKLAGVIVEGGKGLISKDNDGQLDFELTNIVIKGFSPLDELAAKILMKKRFEQLSFAPLKNSLEIKGSDVHIPLMEIQSNAFNMFIEGTYSYGDNTNIWVSIPLDNFKTPDRNIIPAPRGYAATKRKIHVEVTTDAKGNNKFKFHLRRKKFYKQRGILEQYREDLKMYRKIRKEQKMLQKKQD